jgi:hypothetical protein
MNDCCDKCEVVCECECPVDCPCTNNCPCCSHSAEQKKNEDPT